jgi:hypothetical protein
VLKRTERIIANSERDETELAMDADPEHTITRVSKGALKMMRNATDALKTIWEERTHRFNASGTTS